MSFSSPPNIKLKTTLLIVVRKISGEYVNQVCTSLEAWDMNLYEHNLQ